jgi:hypothetical protein
MSEPYDNKQLITDYGLFLKKYRKFFSSFENSHAYRYVCLVETSDLGEDCRYAKASLKLWEKDQLQQEMLELENMQSNLAAIISSYKTMQNKEKE